MLSEHCSEGVGSLQCSLNTTGVYFRTDALCSQAPLFHGPTLMSVTPTGIRTAARLLDANGFVQNEGEQPWVSPTDQFA